MTHGYWLLAKLCYRVADLGFLKGVRMPKISA